MSGLKVKVVEMGGVLSTKSASASASKFLGEPVQVDLDKLNLSLRIKELIREGKGLEDYEHDRSRAVIAACTAMLAVGCSELAIASVLTDSANKLSSAALERRAGNRSSAMQWVVKHNIGKAKKYLESQRGFEMFSRPVGVEADGGLVKAAEPTRLNLTFERFENIALRTGYTALIENLVDQRSTVLLFGDSNCGKTFAAIDIAMHVARGVPWNGRKVLQGLVIYIAAEGGEAILKRIVAYRQYHKLEGSPVPFQLARGMIDLRDPSASTQPLIAEIKKIEIEYGQQVRMIVVDTLSRALSGGDENSGEDMGGLIKSTDTIREETGATILIVHHRGKDKGRGARGHSSLRCSVDTEILAEKKEGSATGRLKITKQRDYEIGDPIGFYLHKVEVAHEDDGRAIESCVALPESLSAILDFEPTSMNRLASNALEALEAAIETLGVEPSPSSGWPAESRIVNIRDWQQEFRRQFYQGRPKSTFSSAFNTVRQELSSLGFAEIKGDMVRIHRR